MKQTALEDNAMTNRARTLLVTFAGRRDRMELLTHYVEAAIKSGLIDEWHVWEFSRDRGDSRWLRERFPVVQATPNYGVEYFRAPQLLSARQGKARLHFSVRATSDVHIGLRRTSGLGPSFEIVLGGWGNQASAIRQFEDAQLVRDVERRDPLQQPAVFRSSRNLLPEFGFTEIEIEIVERVLRVFVAGELLLENAGGVEDGDFEVLYRTGYGSNGDWRFEGFAESAARLFICGDAAHQPPDTKFYNRAYQYYTANRGMYVDDIFLKCDDDIIYFDIKALGKFIDFRRQNKQYFLVSANVVNNGVCAYYQQALGSIPIESGSFELPPGGLCGSLWSDGMKAEMLHNLFLKEKSRFATLGAEVVNWNERISINFVAFLGSDLVHIPDIMLDDEHDLCYGVRKRSRKHNCIFLQFLASHLSFWKQDASMDILDIIHKYSELSRIELTEYAA